MIYQQKRNLFVYYPVGFALGFYLLVIAAIGSAIALCAAVALNVVGL